MPFQINSMLPLFREDPCQETPWPLSRESMPFILVCWNAPSQHALKNKLMAKKSKVLVYCADPGMAATSLANHFESTSPGTMDFTNFGKIMIYIVSFVVSFLFNGV